MSALLHPLSPLAGALSALVAHSAVMSAASIPRFAAGPAALNPAPGLFVFFGHLAASACRNMIRARAAAIADRERV